MQSVHGLLSAVLARILQGQFSKNLPSLVADQFLTSHPQYLTTLVCLQQESCRVSLARVPLDGVSSWELSVHCPLACSFAINLQLFLLYLKLSPFLSPTAKPQMQYSLFNKVCHAIFNKCLNNFFFSTLGSFRALGAKPRLHQNGLTQWFYEESFGKSNLEKEVPNGHQEQVG